MNQVLELYGVSIANEAEDWSRIVALQNCPFTDRRCIKIRKSQPDVTIGTCVVSYGREAKSIMICPNRLLERRQIFVDCIHLLSLHEPGNELHLVQEVALPGGSVDFFLISARNRKVIDFLAVELQTLDTTGTVWPARQRAISEKSLVEEPESSSPRRFGMNWKMTAKTILVQMNHKIQTMENLNKHLILVVQDHLFEYMKKEFSFDHIVDARLGDSAHFHVYSLEEQEDGSSRLSLASRLSTDADGIKASLGLQVNPNVKLSGFIRSLESRMNNDTVLPLL